MVDIQYQLPGGSEKPYGDGGAGAWTSSNISIWMDENLSSINREVGTANYGMK